MKRCPRCKKSKPLEEFAKQGYCRPCSRSYINEYNAKKRALAKASTPIPAHPVKKIEPVAHSGDIAELNQHYALLEAAHRDTMVFGPVICHCCFTTTGRFSEVPGIEGYWCDRCAAGMAARRCCTEHGTRVYSNPMRG